MNVLVLKGENNKSTVTGLILGSTHSLCIEYYDYPIALYSWFLNKREYSLENLKECIEEAFEYERKDNPEKHYDYLIVYTNEKEKDLDELISWLKEYYCPIFCGAVLVTCKE